MQSDLTKRTTATIGVMCFLVGALLLAALLPGDSNKINPEETKCYFAVTVDRYPDAVGSDPVDCDDSSIDAGDTEWYCDTRTPALLPDFNAPAPGNNPANC